MDGSNKKIVKEREQVNFIEKLPMPIYIHLYSIFDKLREPIKNMEVNKQLWNEKLKQEHSSSKKKLSNISIWQSKQVKGNMDFSSVVKQSETSVSKTNCIVM